MRRQARTLCHGSSRMQKIIGHEGPVRVLSDALASGMIPHAWIFSGPPGIGKFTTALSFSSLLLDPHAKPGASGLVEHDPGGRMERPMEAEQHPDLHVIRKELALYADDPSLRNRKLISIPIGVLRQFMLGDDTHESQVYRSPTLGHNKVFIIDEAELLGVRGETIAQNALLKTLEEPPPTTFILVTASPERLLPTVHSRCRHLHFSPLHDEDMKTWLSRSDLETEGIDDDWLLRCADGSPGAAERAVRFDLSSWQNQLDPMLDMLRLGEFPIEMPALLTTLVETYAKQWAREQANASRDVAQKEGNMLVLRILSAEARQALRCRCAAGEDPTRNLEVIDLLRDAERQLAGNVNWKLVLENLIVQWAAPGPALARA